MEKEYAKFRTSTFGGFKRKDVIDYIEKLRNEYFEYKTQVEETVKGLKDKIAEFEKAAENVEAAGEKLEATCEGVAKDAEIDLSAKHLKMAADELCKSLSDFMQRLSQKELISADGVEEEQINVDISEIVNTAVAEKLEKQDNAENKVNVVEEILSFGAGFAFTAGEPAYEVAEAEFEEAEDDTVNEILGSLSFLK